MTALIKSPFLFSLCLSDLNDTNINQLRKYDIDSTGARRSNLDFSLTFTRNQSTNFEMTDADL